MKKICCVTSGRWDYGHLYWVIKNIEASDKLKLTIIASGNHHNKNELEEYYYSTFALTRRHAVYFTNPVNSISDYGAFYTDCLNFYKIIQPDIVIVLGDRFEIHAAATAALLLNIPIAHIHGGEKNNSGSFDDELRNSITMMADIHLTATEKYAQNVARMIGKCYCYDHDIGECGIFEHESSIFNVGSPGLDWLTHAKLYSRQELQQYVTIDLSKLYILACFHPVTKDLMNTERQMCEFLNALVSTKKQVILIRPNIDPCNDKINRTIDDYDGRALLNNWQITNSFDHLTYLSLMKYAEMMVGNSSSGIIEAASFNLPAVDIGTRQQGRIKPPNVISCGYGTDEILAAIDKAKKYDRTKPIENSYGDGYSSERIVHILEEVT